MALKTIFNVSEEKTAKLAVLIDADNASAKDIKNILDELTKYGEATVKRIYGNFTSTQNTQWKKVINELAIKPVQQFEYTTGKNATDGFMIIDAMDLLYTNRFDGFAIVSSDSDFTALAIRIKEQGATVYGFGKKQTPEAFRNSCSQFIYVENLHTEEEEEIIVPKMDNKPISKQPEIISNKHTIQTTSTALPLHTIKQIFDNQDSEWITVASFGSQWKLLQTDFDPRNYGFKKLGDLVKNTPQLFEYDERTLENGHKHSYMKLKKPNP